ncbi:MAG TPA: serine/threonine-protein kinase [Thermoanaerobaculia bacterium]|nr:serine/threonine-protein kinase [Thermoanaerobaculia bacterium]
MTSGSGSFPPGTVLDGKYEIVGLLGVGGMGEVYKARHVHLGTFRCIKIVKAGLLSDEANRARFLREAQLATQIHHPNVAVVHDFSILSDGTSYMVSEFIDGTTVKQWEAANGRFPLALATEVSMQVLAGLDYIHRRGLLHRDVSADNIMLAFDRDEHLVVKIIDLGVAKDISKKADVTQDVFMGNPKYMSPEQLGELEEGESLDGRTDLYSLGIVLFEMLAGAPPFSSRTANGYIVKHLTQPAPAFDEVSPELEFPLGLEPVVLRALEKQRTKRYPSARVFAEALAPYVSHIPTTFSRTEAPPPEKLGVSEEQRIAEEAWASALASDTYSSFRDYRTRFPDHHEAEAERALEERLAYDTASAMDTEASWTDYLEKWGGDRHASAANERLNLSRVREETAYSVALMAKSAAPWRAFLEEFPDGALSTHAEEHLREVLAFDIARKKDRAALEEFLSAYPDGIMAKDARQRLSVIDAGDDARAWAAAQRAGTSESYHAYLKAHPEGVWASDARRALARLAIVDGDFNAAFEDGKVGAWDHWLETYKDSPRIAEAQRCRQEAAEFEMAAAIDTRVMWRAFLKAWPQGRHRLDAEVRLRE